MEPAHLLFGLVVSVLGCSCFRVVFAADMIGLRLADGRYPNEGRVEVLPPGEDTWGTYCSNENPFKAGRVACRQLGFPALLSATATGEFGWATGPIWFQLIWCGDSKGVMTVDECLSLEWWPSYQVCDHRFDVGLTCFTGNLRLVGGRSKTEGRVELHVGGDEWVLLSFRGSGFTFMHADSVCQYLGYPFAVGPTQEPAVNNHQRILCSFSHCPLGYSSGFFECLDELTLMFCPDKNTTLVGAVCATDNDVLPSDASFEYRLIDQTTNGSQHMYMGIIEARYNGSSWGTVCLQVFNDFQAEIVVGQVCQSLGYPWAFFSKMIPYSESPGYVSTGKELIMRELVSVSMPGEVRWVRGKNACQRHEYELLYVECETGVTMYGLTVFPCAEQTCRGRCGRPATNKLCGCDAVCSQCTDCCYDYTDRCSLQEDQDNRTPRSLGSFICRLVEEDRVLIVEGCSPGWNDTHVVQQCANNSHPGPIQYQEGVLLKNLHCAECNGLESSELIQDLSIYNIGEYDVGIGVCNLEDVDPEIALGCQAYSAIIDAPGGLKFKNPHCAYCNGVNISNLDYCIFHYSAVLPAHFEILLGRVPELWAPSSSTSLQLQDEIKCYDKHTKLHVLPTYGGNSSVLTEAVQCYLNTLGWQNIQLTWPFYSSFIDHQQQAFAAEMTELVTEFASNITDFEEILDMTVLPPHEEGSSRDWVVRCGVEQVDFVEICGTAANETINGTFNKLPCEHSIFTTRASDTRVFSMGGVQVIYVGGGVLVEAKSVSFFRSYNYQIAVSNGSAKDTRVSVCGQMFENKECRLPHAGETQTVKVEDGAPGLEYKGRNFLEDRVTHLPDGWVLICSSIFSDPKEPYISFSDPLTLVNVIGYFLSLVALLVTFTNYCVFPVLRNVPGAAIMSLTAALFLAQLLTLTVLDKAENQTVCISMAVLVHFLWLATFTWMNVLAFDLMRTFTSRHVARPNKRVFFTYCLYGWGLPLLAVTTCLVIHFVDGQRVGFRYGGVDSCWVIGKYAVLGAFIAPMVCSLIANAVLFILTVRSVHASLAAAAMVRQDKSKSQETLGELCIYFKISCVMGFTWLFGCLGNFVDSQAIWYIFIILNSLQGVFIFASFGFNARVRNLWRDKLGTKAKRKNKKAPNSSTISSSVTNRTSSESRAQIMTSEVAIGMQDVHISTHN